MGRDIAGRPYLNGGGEDGECRGNGTGERGAAAAAVPPQRGQPAHQREPGLRDGAPGGPGQRPVADRRPLRRHHPPGRCGADTGLPLLRADSRGEPAVRRISQRDAVLRAAQQHRRAAAAAGLPRLRQGAGPAGVPAADGGELAPSLPCRAAPSPGGGRRWHLRGREGDRVHRRGRGDPGDVRLPSGLGHRQRAAPPGRAAGPGRPGDPGEHHAGRRPGLRRENREPGVDQPGGEADRQRPVRAGRDGGAAAGGADLPAGRRAGGLPWRSSPCPRG